MSIYFKNGKISEEGIYKQIDFLQGWISEREKGINNNLNNLSENYFSLVSDYNELCSAFLHIKQFNEIIRYRRRCAEILHHGQRKYGFKSGPSEFMIGYGILSRDVDYYKGLAIKLLSEEIEPDNPNLRAFLEISLLSHVYIIVDDKRADDTIQNFLTLERQAIKSGHLTGIGKNGFAPILRSLFYGERKRFVNEILNILKFRYKTYKREGSLPNFIFPSYFLFLSRDKGMNIDVKTEIPEKYHIIIPDVLHFD